MLDSLITRLDMLVVSNHYKSTSKKHYPCTAFVWFHFLVVAVVVKLNIPGKGTACRYAALRKSVYCHAVCAPSRCTVAGYRDTWVLLV